MNPLSAAMPSYGQGQDDEASALEYELSILAVTLLETSQNLRYFSGLFGDSTLFYYFCRRICGVECRSLNKIGCTRENNQVNLMFSTPLHFLCRT